jgi:hypothetical protein
MSSSAADTTFPWWKYNLPLPKPSLPMISTAPVLRLRLSNWMMSGRGKSLSVPSSAMVRSLAVYSLLMTSLLTALSVSKTPIPFAAAAS